MCRQVSNKFDTIEQGQKTVQQLIQELTKYPARMVQYLDDYSFRRRLIAVLRPSLQKEVYAEVSLQNSVVCKNETFNNIPEEQEISDKDTIVYTSDSNGKPLLVSIEKEFDLNQVIRKFY